MLLDIVRNIRRYDGNTCRRFNNVLITVTQKTKTNNSGSLVRINKSRNYMNIVKYTTHWIKMKYSAYLCIQVRVYIYIIKTSNAALLFVLEYVNCDRRWLFLLREHDIIIKQSKCILIHRVSSGMHQDYMYITKVLL